MRIFKPIPLEISDYLSYSPDSPSGLIWIKSTGRKSKPGKPAGCLKPTGYWEVRFQKKEYLAHRVIISIEEGLLETDLVDHKDGNPSNNDKDNLRKALCFQNSANSKVHQDKEGPLPKGLYEDKRKPGCFFASICHKGKKYTKGSKDILFLKKWLAEKRENFHGTFANEGQHDQGYPQV